MRNYVAKNVWKFNKPKVFKEKVDPKADCRQTTKEILRNNNPED